MRHKNLQDAFASWSAAGIPLVLATVYETQGSTYSKAGAQMLITGDGRFQGMLSGGCLEGDLAERAAQVIQSDRPESVTYDLAENDEDLWGLGVGCDGLMRIFLQPLTGRNMYQPFTAIAEAISGDAVQLAVFVIDSDDERINDGASLVSQSGKISWTDLEENAAARLLENAPAHLPSGDAVYLSLAVDDARVSVLFSPLKPRPRLLVLGAGLDAEPVVRFASELGIRVTIADHRPAYIQAGEFRLADSTHCWPAAELANSLELNQFSACVVMSHHLETDRVYLEQLASSSVSYIGLLGPPGRKHKLMTALGSAGESLDGRLHGPAGIKIGARGPAPIALSIIAEVQGHLARNY